MGVDVKPTHRTYHHQGHDVAMWMWRHWKITAIAAAVLYVEFPWWIFIPILWATVIVLPLVVLTWRCRLLIRKLLGHRWHKRRDVKRTERSWSKPMDRKAIQEDVNLWWSTTGADFPLKVVRWQRTARGDEYVLLVPPSIYAQSLTSALRHAFSRPGVIDIEISHPETTKVVLTQVRTDPFAGKQNRPAALEQTTTSGKATLGIDAEGREVVAELTHPIVVAGQSGFGKTNAVRAIAVAAVRSGMQLVVVDPLGDLADFADIATLYAGEDNAKQVLSQLLGEARRRADVIRERRLERIAADDPDNPATLVVMDEVQEIASPEMITRLAKTGRKLRLIPLFSTQETTKDALPPGAFRQGAVRVLFRSPDVVTRLVFGDKTTVNAVELPVGRAFVTTVADGRPREVAVDHADFDAVKDFIAKSSRRELGWVTPSGGAQGADAPGEPGFEQDRIGGWVPPAQPEPPIPLVLTRCERGPQLWRTLLAGPCTNGQLANATGLHKKTVAGYMQKLAEEGIVEGGWHNDGQPWKLASGHVGVTS